jgi:hypothetical protein
MDIVYVDTGKNDVGNVLLGTLEPHIGNKNIRIYKNIVNFSEDLKKNTNELTIAVIFIADEEDLMELYAIKHLLHSVITILILPDRERDTVALGFRCKPYFMTYVDHDLNEIVHTIRTLTSQSTHSVVYNRNYQFSLAA